MWIPGIAGIISPDHRSGQAVVLPPLFHASAMGEAFRFEDHGQSPFCALTHSPRREVFRLTRVSRKKGSQQYYSRDTHARFDPNLRGTMVGFFHLPSIRHARLECEFQTWSSGRMQSIR